MFSKMGEGEEEKVEQKVEEIGAEEEQAKVVELPPDSADERMTKLEKKVDSLVGTLEEIKFNFDVL